MPSKSDIIQRTKPYRDQLEVITEEQSTKDIIRAILASHQLDERDYDKICMLFDADSAEEIGYKIWNFLKGNVPYVVESEEFQSVRSPGALMSTADDWGADCKNYSLFAGGVIDALNRRGAGIDWCYRFASYKLTKPAPYHVFVVMYPGTDDEIWVDAVLSGFDQKKRPIHFKDKKMLGRVSGIATPSQMVNVNGRLYRIGDDDDFDDDGGFSDGSDFTYGSEEDPGTGSSPADVSSGFDLSSGAGAGIANQASPDLGSGITDPSGDATALTPDQAGNFDYNPTTGQYEAVNPDGTYLTNSNATVPSSGGGFLSNLWNSLTGGSSGSSGGGGAGGGSGGLSSGSQPKPTSQQQTGTGGNIIINPAQASTNNNTLYIVLGAAALIGIILITRKK